MMQRETLSSVFKVHQSKQIQLKRHTNAQAQEQRIVVI